MDENCGNWDSVIVKFVKCWNAEQQILKPFSDLRFTNSPIVGSCASKFYWCFINVHCLKSKIVLALGKHPYLMVQNKLLEVYAHLIILCFLAILLIWAHPMYPKILGIKLKNIENIYHSYHIFSRNA